MTGAYRFTTDPLTCLRVWRWFPRVGRPEIAGLVGPCVRAGAVALVGALAPVAPWVPPAVPVVPVFAEALLPPYPAWVGVPGGGYGLPAYGSGYGVPASGYGLGFPDRLAPAGAGPGIGAPIFPAEANRNGLAAVEGPAPYYPFLPLITQTPPFALADIPVTTIGDQARQDVPEVSSWVLLATALLIAKIWRSAWQPAAL